VCSRVNAEDERPVSRNDVRHVRAQALVLAVAGIIAAGCVTITASPQAPCHGTAATIETPRDLDFALDMRRGVADVRPEDPAEEAATLRFLATLPRVDELLVDHSLVLSQLHLQRRRSVSTDDRGIPDLTVTALWMEHVPASMLAAIGPEFMAWLTLNQATVGVMAPDKPSPVATQISGRTVQQTLWDDHQLAWFDHGEVLYVVLTANPQLLALAIDELPAPRVITPACAPGGRSPTPTGVTGA
jgi:hypothetical protein